MNAVKTLDRRIIIGALLITMLAAGFWSGSRVPALNEKATMGTEINFNELGFDTVFEIQPDDNLATRVLFTTVNWVDTNKKGMTFGVLFAAGIMTLFSLMRRRSFKGGFANSVLGLVIGTPLGVCVNCAAPIAAGMAAAGSRLETTLATMISSPTLNVIVLTILFSLFPIYIVAIKLGFTLVFILLVIPLMSHYLLKKEAEESLSGGKFCGIAAKTTCPIPTFIDESPEVTLNWINAGKWFVVHYLKNLWFVGRVTVPLMLLAGFLGALMITILPWESIAEIIPETNMVMTLLGMVLVALIGVFLPVPISFDIIICAVLLATGMPVKYVMVLLFTLGIFSVYSYFVVAKAVSNKAAFIMYVIITIMGVGAGVVAHQYEKIDTAQKRDFFLTFFLESRDLKEPVYALPEIYDFQQDPGLLATLHHNAVMPVSLGMNPGNGLVIEKTEFNTPIADGDKHFTRVDSTTFGMEVPYRFSLFKMELPYVQGHGRGVSTADVHNDGRVDVLYQAEATLMLYANQGNGKFARQQIDVPQLKNLSIVNAAMVDLNNDGWQDIFFSTYAKGNYVIYNLGGEFNSSHMEKLPNYSEAGMSPSAAFGDIDKDGDLDIVLGNWAMGWGAGTWIATDETLNVILRNDGGKFVVQDLDGHPGIPTSILLTDFTNDGNLDLAIGNDFGPPDYYYIGDGNGNFKMIKREDGIFPHSAYDTMSIASGDINNDLRPDLYVAEIAYYDDHHKQFYSVKPIEVCEKIKDKAFREKCVTNAEVHELFTDIKQKKTPHLCLTIENETLRNECVALFIARRPVSNGGYASRESCDSLPDSWSTTRTLCYSNLQKAFEMSKEEKKELLSQNQGANSLLISTDDGKFIDKAVDMGVNLAGWTWNAKFADLDNDEWQDLYAVNGTFDSKRRRESNYFFHNKEGKKFVNETDERGLTSFLPASSYSYVDIDDDGDLDIITVPISGPVDIYMNNTINANSIAIELRDKIGNSRGIGSKVIISYGQNGERKQMREIQAGGGFISYDAPVAHFGLAANDNVTQIEIIWSTGERSIIDGNFTAGARYRITRTDTFVGKKSKQAAIPVKEES